MTVFFDKSFTSMPERIYTSPEHFDKNLSRDIVDIIFSLNQFAHQLISPFKSFTTTNRAPALLITQFFASASGFLLRKGEESFKRTNNSTKPPLTQIIEPFLRQIRHLVRHENFLSCEMSEHISRKMATCLTWDYFLNACKRFSWTTKTSAFTLRKGVKRGRPESFPNNRSTEWRVFVNAKSVLSALTNHVAAHVKLVWGRSLTHTLVSNIRKLQQ